MSGDVRHTLLLPFNTEAVAPPAAEERLLFVNALPLPTGSPLPPKTLIAEQPQRGLYLELQAAGYDVQPLVDKRNFSGALVLCGRSRRANERAVASARDRTGPDGVIVVAGDKTAGIQPLQKWVSERADITASLSKHHARVFWFKHDGAEWSVPIDICRVADFQTSVAGFSPDKIDPGSHFLASHPQIERLAGRVADFGAGWGYLSAQALKRASRISQIDLFEAHHGSLTAARANITDQRARFHWADLTREAPGGPFDWIIMNPPFHEGRAAQPALGTAFIEAAARALPHGGRLLMVANTHLPYERTLQKAFRNVETLAREQGFKLIEARR